MSPFSFRIRPLVRPSFPTPGGDEEIRTPDPLRAKQVLSQLSYTPISEAVDSRLRFPILKIHSRTFKIEQKPTEAEPSGSKT